MGTNAADGLRADDGLETTVVTLLVYSGRRNPSWELDATATNRLLELLRQLKSRPGLPETDAPPPLGYAGFEVRSERFVAAPGAMRAFHGVITLGSERALVDPRRDVETFLLASAGPALAPELRRWLSQEIPPPSSIP